MKKPTLKIKRVYVVKKIIVADTLRQAIEKEKDTPISECYIEPDVYRMLIAQNAGSIILRDIEDEEDDFDNNE